MVEKTNSPRRAVDNGIEDAVNIGMSSAIVGFTLGALLTGNIMGTHEVSGKVLSREQFPHYTSAQFPVQGFKYIIQTETGELVYAGININNSEGLPNSGEEVKLYLDKKETVVSELILGGSQPEHHHYQRISSIQRQ